MENGRRSDQVENGLWTGSENVFWNILISDSTLRAETSFFHTYFSRRISWCLWEPPKTLILKKLMNSQNANGPHNKTYKIFRFALKWLQKIDFRLLRPGSGSKCSSECNGDGPKSPKPRKFKF